MEPKSYQRELYLLAKNGNVIIKLNTGSGKTFIASMVIKDYLNNDNKKIFFLVKNASLAQQHAMYLRQYLFLKDEVGFFHGNMNSSWVDFWTKDKWAIEIAKHKIIIMTAKVFLDIINHKKFSLENVCLLIFDEVHHLTKADDYVQISEHLLGKNFDIKVMGLTACLVKTVKKLSDIDFFIDDIEMRLRCKVVTSYHSLACEFSKNIKNVYIDFDNYVAAEMDELKAILDSSTDAIQLLNANEPTGSKRISNDLGYLLNENPLQDVRRYINDVSSVLSTLGIIPCQLIVDIYIKDLPSMMRSMESSDIKYLQSLREFEKCLTSLKERLHHIIKKSKFLNISLKLQKLIKFILDIKPLKQDEANYILIFVKERIHALALNEFLGTLPELSNEFEFIKSQYIIGHTTCSYPKKLELNGRQQMDILNKFRQMQFNVLVATNVVEEGLDIPHCNVVIKFEPPSEFRSYLQSKGRARANDSQYVIIVPSEDLLKVKLKISFFDQVNKKINELLQSRAVECDSSDDDSDDSSMCYESTSTDYMPYGKHGPRITLNSASGVLNRYIGKLRYNSLSEMKILYKVEKNKADKFRTSLVLPMPSPYLEEITSGFHSRKRLSKQYANLEACKILHNLEELDKDLLPYNRYEVEDELGLEKKSGSAEIGRYEKYVAKKLSSEYLNLSSSTTTLYLYSIRYSPSVFSKLGIEDFTSFNMSESIGILLSRPIHKSEIVVEFPIYLVGGKCSTVIAFERKVCVTSQELDTFLKCHQTLFEIYAQRIRKFHPDISFNPTESKCSIIITILKDFKVDYEAIKTILSKRFVVKLEENLMSTWKGSVIRPIHLKKEFGAFVIVDVCKDKTMESTMENNELSYVSYLKKQYGITFTEEEVRQPLIKVKRLTTIQSCANKEKRSLKESRRLQKINSSENYHIPCLSECISLSSSIWTQLCIFPTIHLRLNQIFIVEEFTSSLDFINLLPSPDVFELDFDTCYKIENISSKDLYMDITNFINNIFPCFVGKMCNDRMDLEQYEILGDSFLKLISTKYLFHFSKPTDNEGKLTQMRSKLISNKNLFNLAQARNLSRYFFSTNFDPKVNYLPPNCVVSNADIDDRGKNPREFVSYKNKCLADCVEALVGSMITNYGDKYAVKFLLWMGMNLLPPEFIKDFEVRASPPIAYCRGIDLNDFIPDNISELESILQYKFRYKAYAVQAITHPSSTDNRKFSCYQRLEFLGDAVLDFLVTKYIMVNNRKLRPGKITSLRSALVSNSTFAYLSAKWELHKFLNYFDMKMFFALPDVVESLLQNKLECSTLFSKISENQKVIVKVLGDIFESIAGAIFLDSDYNLDTVWIVYKRLMAESLKKFSNHIPKNKIVLLYEKFPKLKCDFEIEEGTNMTILSATLPDGKVIKVKETNKTLCKLSLAESLLL